MKKKLSTRKTIRMHGKSIGIQGRVLEDAAKELEHAKVFIVFEYRCISISFTILIPASLAGRPVSGSLAGPASQFG